MSATWIDVALRVQLDSTVVIAQALLLNHLGIPFAGIGLFTGVASYAVAVVINHGLFASLPILAYGVLLLVGLVVLAPSLPRDRYLLLSLACLSVSRSVAGSFPLLGGQLGISSATRLLPAQSPAAFLPGATCLFLIALCCAVALDRSQLGLAVRIARLARAEHLASALVPMPALRWLLFVVTAVLGAVAGAVQAMYSGRVDPNVFRVEWAITLVIVTLAMGRTSRRMIVVALGFFLFPDAFAAIFGYQRVSAAYLRDVAWSLAILILGARGLGEVEAIQAKPVPVSPPVATNLARDGDG